MRAITRVTFQSAFLALVVGVARISARSHLFRTDDAQALVDLIGCVMTAGSLYGVLAIRSFANNVPRAHIADEGALGLAVTLWLFAFVPPRSSNFLPTGATDDFIWGWVPVVLLGVTACRVLTFWKAPTTVAAQLTRVYGIVAACLPVLGFIVRRMGGPDADQYFTHCLVAAAGSALIAVLVATVPAVGRLDDPPNPS